VEAIGSLELCMCLLYPLGKSIQLALVGLRGTAAMPRRFVAGHLFAYCLQSLVLNPDRPTEQKHNSSAARSEHKTVR
jgi:hypothetical protein